MISPGGVADSTLTSEAEKLVQAACSQMFSIKWIVGSTLTKRGPGKRKVCNTKSLRCRVIWCLWLLDHLQSQTAIAQQIASISFCPWNCVRCQALPVFIFGFTCQQNIFSICNEVRTWLDCLAMGKNPKNDPFDVGVMLPGSQHHLSSDWWYHCYSGRYLKRITEVIADC